jgi:catechol 2,3-dioxygenase-like lactoylglutathione lyase family enzyme
MGVSRIILICNDVETAALFYARAFGFVRAEDNVLTTSHYRGLTGARDAESRIVTLRLGDQEIELAGPYPSRERCPTTIPGWSPLFQHFAIVVSDMAEAYARLLAQKGWRAISTDGPEVLPASSGGVTAYKFSDTEGHPLELIAFAPDRVPAIWQRSSSTNRCLGIDHSAISVRDTTRSVAFYRDLGFKTDGGSYNVGSEQDRLDAIAGARVKVTALVSVPATNPHIELLCYQGDFDRSAPLPDLGNSAATRLVLTAKNYESLFAICHQNAAELVCNPTYLENGTSWAMLRDPDGHLLCIEALS